MKEVFETSGDRWDIEGDRRMYFRIYLATKIFKP